MLEVFEPFIGCWESADGFSRQELAWGMERLVVRTRMWFRDGDGWKQVSEGAFYSDPGRDEVVGFAEAIDMPITHFATTARGTDEGLDLEHTSYDLEGNPMQTAERWQTLGGDGFVWQLFQRAGDELTPWIDGEWKRVDG